MCTNIFCLPPQEVDVVYFLILLTTSALNCLVALASLFLVAKWIRQKWRATRQYTAHLPSSAPPSAHAAASLPLAPPLAVVVPCYLPNEQGIIHSTVEHIAHNLEYAGRLTIHVVYNTPTPLEAEEALLALDGRELAPGRTVRVLHAASSTSKAENLDLVLGLVTDTLVALYDADHRPDPPSLKIMVDELRESECHCVQGSTYIRDTHSSLLAKAINAEFFVTHFVYFPAMEVLAGTGYFGGSNALWRMDVLRKYSFDRSMHCEDVDVSARVILDNHRLHFCPTARSGELSPDGPVALVQQRLRWFIGWEQVTHKYYWRVFMASLTPMRKLGFCYLFHLRWVLLLAALMGAVINPIVTSPFIYPLPTWSLAIQATVYCTVTFYAFVAAISLAKIAWYEPHRPSSWVAVALFFVFGWVYVFAHFALQAVAFCKVLFGQSGTWVVTRRAADLSDAAIATVSSGARRVTSVVESSLVSGALKLRSGIAPRAQQAVAGGVARSGSVLAEPLLDAEQRQCAANDARGGWTRGPKPTVLPSGANAAQVWPHISQHASPPTPIAAGV